METYIFASDPHGTGQPWINNVKKMTQLYPDATIVFGGDYIDGRKFSLETLNFVKDQTEKNHAVALLGNHEQMLLEFINASNQMDQKLNYDLWKQNGGKSTIKSLTKRNWSYRQSAYQLRKQQTPMIKWLETLKPSYITGTLVFVHAGFDLNLKNPLTETSISDQIWIREDYWWETDCDLRNPNYYWHHKPLAQTIVSGHTPTCLLYGRYDTDPNPVTDKSNDKNFDCPVKSIQYPNEAARIFTDGGCHSQLKDHCGNIIAINTNGKILKVIK